MKALLIHQQVIVFGASSGIGLAVAKLIASQGAIVTIASRTKERLEKAAAEIDQPNFSGGDRQKTTG